MVYQRHEALLSPEEKSISSGGQAEGEGTGEGVQETNRPCLFCRRAEHLLQ